METGPSNSKSMLWTGRVITILVVLFMVVDAGMKIVKAQVSMDGSIQLGWPAEFVQAIGFTLMICTILYVIPRTAVFGAILMTGYLGGAISIMIKADAPYYFPAVMAVLAWVGLLLRDARLRAVMTTTA